MGCSCYIYMGERKKVGYYLSWCGKIIFYFCCNSEKV